MIVYLIAYSTLTLSSTFYTDTKFQKLIYEEYNNQYFSDININDGGYIYKMDDLR